MAFREQRTLEIDQGGAGTTTLLAAIPETEIRVLNYLVVLSVAGTYAFSDGTDWFTGDIPTLASGGVFAAAADPDFPLFVTGRGRPLSITTVGGSAHGHARIELR